MFKSLIFKSVLQAKASNTLILTSPHAYKSDDNTFLENYSTRVEKQLIWQEFRQL